MTKLPSLRARQVSEGLQASGFQKVRQNGSHAISHHLDCRRAPIPTHPSTTISPYFLSDILKQLEIDEEEFLKSIKRR